MRAKIVLADGVVVEAEGTAGEIAGLTAALGQSHRIDEPAGRRTGVLPRPGPRPASDSTSVPDLDGLVPGDALEPWEDEDKLECALPDFDDEQDLHIADVPVLAGATPTSAGDVNRSPAPPLDLVVRAVADQFRLLADPTRLQILIKLAERCHNVGEICDALGGMSQPAVSHHLTLLRVSGLVTPSREGKFNYYDLTEQGRTLTEAVGRFGTPDGSGTVARFRQASDPTRLQVLVALSEGDRNVSELCSDLGGMSQPAVSHHLALLRHGGLVESRRAGKFSFYSLREAGRQLTRLVVPMLAAKARADSDPVGGTLEAEEYDFSSIPDDWMDATPSPEGDAGDDDEIDPLGVPPAHMLCRRVLLMVRELHRRGYERLRIAPGLSPSSLHWSCSIVPADHVRPDHGAIVSEGEVVAARYDSSQGAGFFGWADAELDTPLALAEKFFARYSGVAAQGKGGDHNYACWYAHMLHATNPCGLIYAYADWELPGGYLPALGCTAAVKIPLPPPGEASSG